MKRLSCVFLAGVAILAPAPHCQQKNPGSMKAFPDPGVTTTRQQITPAGIQSVFEGAVYGTIFDRDPSLVWVLKHLRATCGDMRKNDLRNADTVLYVLFPFHICEAVAVRRRPPGRSYGEHQTGRDNQSRAELLKIHLTPICRSGLVEVMRLHLQRLIGK